jgi:hypothetical protein
MTMQLIETKTLGSETTAINFTSIPQDYTDLLFVFSLRDALAGNNSNNIILAINGSTANQTARTLNTIDGFAPSSFSDTLIYFRASNSNDSTANTFSNGSLYFPNYTSSANKSLSVEGVAENNSANAAITMVAGLWSNTAAINSIEFRSNATVNYRVGSTISLYGITKGSDGIVTTS